MTFLNRLERRIGFIAIPSLIRAVVLLTALVCVLAYTNPTLLAVLDLDPELIKHGQFWRLITFLFIPSSPVQPGAMLSPIWAVMALYFLWFIGDGLERAWGAFSLTLYFLVGALTTIGAAFLTGVPLSNGMIAASLFFAFAWFYPDEVIYLFFILPVKIKWLAWISAVLLGFAFVSGSNAARLAMLIALSNYVMFFGPQIVHQARHRKDISARRKRFEVQSRSTEEPLHRCATCGATELSDPNVEFRVSRDGEEYCLPHLPSATAATTAAR
jgi:hypothetical protein